MMYLCVWYSDQQPGALWEEPPKCFSHNKECCIQGEAGAAQVREHEPTHTFRINVSHMLYVCECTTLYVSKENV